jgi:hypothetical protein
MVWGLDLVRPLKKAPSGYAHLLVAMDMFLKRIEPQPITKIKSEEAKLFFYDIIHSSRVLNSIITDNNTQFIGKNSLDSAMTTTTTSIGLLWRTPAPMGRSSVRMT